ncbi:MAG: LCP family protein, partial [Clostridiales bacterium]|nr:LCP family protein [Clostridiales bacterium]
LDTFGEMQSSKSYYNTVQNDFLFLVQTDSENRVCNMLHINRDTMAEIDRLGIGGVKYGTSFEQIALAHTYGDGISQSCVNTKNAVSRLLHGIKIDYYVAMTMDAVVAINDYMGGVSVQIPYDMTNIDESFVVGANVNLLGEASMKFIRARSELEDSSNLSRMERQRIYIKAFLEKISDISITNAFIDSMYSTADKYILTDCPAKNVDEFVKNIGEYEIGDIETVPGEAKLGAEFIEYYADDEKLQKLIAGLFYEKLDK